MGWSVISRVPFIIAKFIFGFTFVVSGFLKMSDPVGTMLVVQEYLRVGHLAFLSGIALHIGLALSLLEFILGASFLSGLRLRFFSWIGLGLMSFFTLLTLVLAIFDPINDCGCFGEAISLTNWQTFFKNVALFLCSLLVFSGRKYYRKLAPSPVEWRQTILISLSILIYGVASLIVTPALDFGSYKVGVDISERLVESSQVQYQTRLLYQKDGREEYFTLENLPDSTWVFVDSEAYLPDDMKKLGAFDFYVTDAALVEITSEIVDPNSRYILLTFTDFLETDAVQRAQIVELISFLAQQETGFKILTSTPYAQISSEVPDNIIPQEYFAFADSKTIISMNRSNGGLVYLNSATVVAKLSRLQISQSRVQKLLDEEDPENIIIQRTIFQNIFSLLVIVFLTISFFTLKVIFRKRYNMDEELVEEETIGK